MKPLFMSWKNYAKKLEIELEYEKKKLVKMEKMDMLLGNTIMFRSPEALVGYIKRKAEVNIKVVARVIEDGDRVTPSTLDYTTTQLMVWLNERRKELKGYIAEARQIEASFKNFE